MEESVYSTSSVDQNDDELERIKKMNLYEKIHAIASSIINIQKDQLVAYGTTRYKAVTEEKVTSMIKPLLTKYRLVVFPYKQKHYREGDLTIVDTEYKVVNIDNPSEYEIIPSSGTGVDSQDKGVGKASTYSQKYLWLRLFNIPTGEDPDYISSEELDDKKRKEQMRHEQEKQAVINDLNQMYMYLTNTMGYHPDHLNQIVKQTVGAFNKLEDLTVKQLYNLKSTLNDLSKRKIS